MAIKISSNGNELAYNATLNISDAQYKAKQLKAVFDQLSKQASTLGDQGISTKGLTGYQQAQLALKATLAASQNETEKLRQESVKYRAELELGRVAQQANKTELERLRAVEQALKNDLQQGKIAQQQYRTEVDRNRVAQQQLTATLAQGRIDQQNLRTEITRMNLARKQEVEAARASRRAAQEVAGSYFEAQKRLKDLDFQIKSAGNGMKSLTPELKAKVKEYNELNDALKRFDASMGNHQRNVGNYKGAIKSTAQDLLGFASAYLSIGNALTYVFNQTLAFQRIKTPLTFILGSEGAADAKLAELKKFADQIGVEYFSIANSYKQFISAARASNFDLKDSEKIFRSVAKAGGVLGLSNDTLQGTFLALQQMISKGTVQSEELRGQLSERLPGAFALAAKAMGVTEQELGKLLKNGEVLASDLLPKLAAQLDQAYGDKAGESISGLNAELNRLYSIMQALGGEGSFLSKNLFEPIVRGAKETANFFYQLTRGGSFLDFMTDITTFTGAETRSRRNLYDARDLAKANQSQLEASKQIDYSKQNLKELRNSYQEVEMQIVKNAKAINEYSKKSKEGPSFTRKETEAYLITLKKQDATYRQNYANIGKAIDDTKKKQVSSNKEIKDSELSSITSIQKRIAELKKQAGSAIAGTDTFKRIEALQERLKKPGSTLPKHDVELNSQRSMQEKIDSLTQKGLNKQLDANQQEVEAIKKKYADLRKAADEFNNDPVNKRRGLKVNASGLDRAESKEVDAKIDDGKAKELKTEFDRLKEQYKAYEDFKDKFGEAKAKERFAKSLNTEISYLQALQNKEDEIRNGDPKAKGGDIGNGEYAAEQLKFLTKEREVAATEERKRNDEFLAQFQTYVDKRAGLQEAMTKKVNKAIADGNLEEAENARKFYQEQILSLGESHVQQLDSYKRFFEDVEGLSAEALSQRLEALKADIAKLDSPELKAFLEKLLKAGQIQLNTKTLDGYKSLADSLNEAANASEGLSAGLAEGLSTAVKIGASLINMKISFDAFNDAQKSNDILGMASAGIQGVSAVMGIASFVSGIFAKAKQFRDENKKVIDEFNSKRFVGEFDINQLYRERVRLQLELNKATLSGLKGNTDALKKQSQEVANDYARIAGLLAGESFITGYKNTVDKMQVINVPVLESLGGKSFADIEKLFMSGQLTDRAKQLFEQLQKLKNEGLDIDKLLAENTKSIMEAATGSTLDQLKSDFLATLTDGTQDFAKKFEQTMQKAILAGFEAEFIREQLTAFYSQFAELAGDSDGLTESEITKLREMYLKASEKAKADLEALSKATGIDLTGKDANNSNSLKGALTSASQDSINILSGYTAGVRLQLVKVEAATISLGGGKSLGDLYLTAKSGLDQLVMIEANTRRTADNTERLKAVENSLVSIDGKIQRGNNNYNPLLSGSGQTGP